MNSMKYPRVLPAGDCSVVVEFGNEINTEINAAIAGFTKAMTDGSVKGIIEVIPTYRSALVTYEPRKIHYKYLLDVIESKIKSAGSGETKAKRIVEVPVCYGGQYGPDLAFVAEHSGLTEQEVINLHSSKPYLIYMLGFQPGFPYLGGLDSKLFTPRLSAPRPMIPAGSVGIGGEQTGLYPVASPAGWQIIGTTPAKCYNPQKSPSIVYEAGDYIQFIPITEEEYLRIEKAESTNSYQFITRVEAQ